MLKAAFIFLAPESDPRQHRAVIETPKVELTVVGVQNYNEAEKTTRDLVTKGITSIELCGGFGHEGTAAVARAAGKDVFVGTVRFDTHPGLGNKSGDTLF